MSLKLLYNYFGFPKLLKLASKAQKTDWCETKRERLRILNRSKNDREENGYVSFTFRSRVGPLVQTLVGVQRAQ